MIERSLAHPSTDPAPLVLRARDALGWEGSDFLVGLDGYDELIATLDVAADLEGMVRIGDPTSPPLALLRALAAAHPDVRLTRVATVPSPWRWTRLGGGSGDAEAVALRQQTYSDVVGAMGRAGVAFRVLPDHTTREELYAVGRELGSAVVDVDELAPDDILITGFLDQQPGVTYGLLARRFDAGADPSVVWLTLSVGHEASGTLVKALERFRDLGVDLDFLHSDPLAPGRHVFYVGFRADPTRVPEVQEALAVVGFGSRVLATFPLAGS